ncbi:hypothetical protein K469DRAFT_742519 [Zopfia rhizophila CBS 207.26]|uniref:GST N-terminal domain-containing protein n=1 Tax=Zopfia rhizophila CBS 207.26 TaxID=1314779 RepID=A0A6A6DG82_9PEZI|nr:hypothetical protein K469DRAFT_742519 [Zopfia rhizophila CBS 207.26]
MGIIVPSKITPTLYIHKEPCNSYKQHSLEFLAINPRGEVPTLVDGEHVFTDRAAILTYLASTHSDPGTPKTPSSYWSSEVIELGTASTPQTLKEDTIQGHKSLEFLDLQLGKEKWLTLGRPTIADIRVFVYVALVAIGGIWLEKYANVRRWIEDIKLLKGLIPIDGLDDSLYKRRQ